MEEAKVHWQEKQGMNSRDSINNLLGSDSKLKTHSVKKAVTKHKSIPILIFLDFRSNLIK